MVPSGEASFTATLIRSPRLAIFPVEPPIGMIISTRRAPEESATSREVCIWITVVTSDYCLEAVHRVHRVSAYLRNLWITSPLSERSQLHASACARKVDAFQRFAPCRQSSRRARRGP